MSNDTFDRFSNFVTNLGSDRPANGVMAHPALLGEDNLRVGSTLISTLHHAVAALERLSTDAHFGRQDTKAKPPEIPTAAGLQDIATSSPVDDNLAAPREMPGPHRRSSNRRDVNKVTWAQLDHVTEPGRYLHRFGWLSISADDIAIWRQFPHASFTLCQRGRSQGDSEYLLGAFDPGDPAERGISGDPDPSQPAGPLPYARLRPAVGQTP